MYIFIYLIICILSIYPFIHASIYLFTYIFTYYLPIYPCINLSMHLFIHYLFIFIGSTSTSTWKCDMPHTPSLNILQYVNKLLNTAENNKSNDVNYNSFRNIIKDWSV